MSERKYRYHIEQRDGTMFQYEGPNPMPPIEVMQLMAAFNSGKMLETDPLNPAKFILIKSDIAGRRPGFKE